MVKTDIIIFLICITSCNATNITRLTRINENGTIIAEPKTGPYYSETRDSEVAEEGYIYLIEIMHYDLYVFSENLDWLGSEDYYTDIVALDDVKNNIIGSGGDSIGTYIRVDDLTLNEKYRFYVPPEHISGLTVDETDGSIWFSNKIYDIRGLYKYTIQGEELYYFPEYNNIWKLSQIAYDGSFWAAYGQNIKRHDSAGNIIAEVSTELNWYRADVYKSDCSLWLVDQYSDEPLKKIDSSGNIVVRYSDLDYISAVDVNQNDGSVWVTDPLGEIVHLDANGYELLRISWYEDFIHEITVDDTDNSVIVFSATGTVYVQPASLGEIKAMFK